MSFKPERKEFLENLQDGKSQLVWTSVAADMETPVSAMLKLIPLSDYHILFESVEGGETKARYSIIALDPDLLWKCDGKNAYINKGDFDNTEDYIPQEKPPFDSLRDLLAESKLDIPSALPPMSAGIFGYMGYDMVRLMEKLPDSNPDNIGIASSIYMRPQIIVIFDSVKDVATIVAPIYHGNKLNPELAYDSAIKRIGKIIQVLDSPVVPDERYSLDAYSGGSGFTPHVSKDEYKQIVEKSKQYIVEGEVFQIVPSRRLSMDFPFSPFALYRSLRHLNPSPYLFYVSMKDFALVGSSPEILVKYEDNTVTIRPLAGTRKRGEAKDEDIALEKELLSDEKELAEHLMLLDLGRNDVGRVSARNSVRVTEQMQVERYSHVMHIVSNVEGKLADDKDCIDALIAGFPAGTVSGAPKIRAMELIDELEKEKRSFYGGTVGYFSGNGNMDTCIALRTALVKGGKVYAQAGGGVVADSDPESEFIETENKAGAIMVAALQATQYL